MFLVGLFLAAPSANFAAFGATLPIYATGRLLPTFFSLSCSACIWGLLIGTRRNENLFRNLSIFVFLLSLLTLLEYFFGRDFSIDHPLSWLQQRGWMHEMAGRMAPNSALNYALLSSALFWLISFPDRSPRLAQYLTFASALIALLAIIGYAYNVQYLYTVADFTAMSLMGAVSFLLFSIGILSLRSEEGAMRILTSERAGGILARRLILSAIVVPPVLGSVTLEGYNHNYYDTAFGIALLVITCMSIFALITFTVSNSLEGADSKRKRLEEKLETSREEFRELSTHVQSMQEEERIRIAREIHDELGQALTALKMDVSLMRSSLTPEQESLRQRATGMLTLVDSTIHAVQRISTELRPGMLDDLGLAAAIEWQAQEFERRTGTECTLEIFPHEIRTDQSRSTAIFRIFQETLTNVARHAAAQHVRIRLVQDPDTITLTVTDDGIGISTEDLSRSKSLGIIGMRERAKLLGGTLQITSVDLPGTVVKLDIPRYDPLREALVREELV
jgi:signal transduction histidine kinase